MGESTTTKALWAMRKQIQAYGKEHGLTEAEAGAVLLRMGLSRAKALQRYARSTKGKAAVKRRPKRTRKQGRG